jgi:cytochrome c
LEPLGDLLIANNNSSATYEKIDLSGISKISVSAFAQKGQAVGGTIEIRLGSATGSLLGEIVIPDVNMTPQEISLNTMNRKPEDLVFLFKNAKADGKPLFGISKIEFKK